MTRRWHVLGSAAIVLAGGGLLFAMATRAAIGRYLPSGDRQVDEVSRPQSDFAVFYAAAMIARTAPSELYSKNAQAQAQSDAVGITVRATDPDFRFFPYPPIVAFLLLPLTILDYPAAYIAMGVVSLLVLSVVTGMLVARLDPGAEGAFLLAFAVVFSVSTAALLVEGQLSAWTFLIYVLLVCDLKRSRELRAGVFVGLLALKTALAPIWMLWLLLTRRWRGLVAATVIGATVVLAPFLIIGSGAFYGYLETTRQMATREGTDLSPLGMPNLRSLAFELGLGDLAWYVSVGLVLAVVVVMSRRPETWWSLAAVALGSILIAPHVWRHDLFPTLLGLAIVLKETRVASYVAGRWSLALAVFGIGYATVLPFSVTLWPLLLFTLFGFFVYRAFHYDGAALIR